MLAQKLLAVAQVGSSAVLYVLIALSVLSIGVILERWLWFRKRRVDAFAVGRAMLKQLKANDRDGATKLLKGSLAVEAKVMVDALEWYEDGPEAVASIVDTSLKERRREMESGLNFLGTLGNNAPFIGLFGTVLGVVTAFRELGATTAGAANGMGNVMSGIAEALVATAIGILVALPAVIAYNVFQKKVVEVEDNVGSLSGLLLAEMRSVRGFAASAAAHAGSHLENGKSDKVRKVSGAEANS